jgi:hypothetical protein
MHLRAEGLHSVQPVETRLSSCHAFAVPGGVPLLPAIIVKQLVSEFGLGALVAEACQLFILLGLKLNLDGSIQQPC